MPLPMSVTVPPFQFRFTHCRIWMTRDPSILLPLALSVDRITIITPVFCVEKSVRARLLGPFPKFKKSCLQYVMYRANNHVQLFWMFFVSLVMGFLPFKIPRTLAEWREYRGYG